MPTFLQLTIEGKTEFIPRRVNYYRFIEDVARRKPELLDPRHHRELMVEFARHVGLEPDRWGMSLSAIKWLMEVSPDVERACRAYRSNAL